MHTETKVVKFDKINEACDYINERLKRKGFLKKDDFLKISTDNLNEITLENLSNDRLLINTLNKLLNNLESLELKLIAQNERIKQQDVEILKREAVKVNTKVIEKIKPPIVIKPLNKPSSKPLKQGKLVIRNLQVQLKKYEVIIEQLRNQLKQRNKNDLTWEINPNISIDVAQEQFTLSTTDISQELNKKINECKHLKITIRILADFMKETNSYLFTRFVLMMDKPKPKIPKLMGNDELDELVKDWFEIMHEI